MQDRSGGTVVYVAAVRSASAVEGGVRLASDVASTRLRVLIPAAQLARRVPVCVVPPQLLATDPSLARLGDLRAVVIGKFSTAQIRKRQDGMRALLAWARTTAARVPLFADLSDDLGALARLLGDDFLGEFQRSLGEICRLVVPTQALATAVAADARHEVTVIEDPYESPLARQVRTVASAPLRLAWFGNLGSVNAPLVEAAIVNAVRPLEGAAVQVEIVAGAAAAPLVQRMATAVHAAVRHVQIVFTAWSVEAVENALARTDFVLLPQDFRSPWGRVKSHNRLVETIRGGRLALASPIPAYAELSAGAWVGEDLGAGLQWALAHPAEAAQRVARGQSDVETRFSPQTIGMRWGELLGVA